MKKILILGCLTTLCSMAVAHAEETDYKNVYQQSQTHTEFPYLPSEKTNPSYLNNHLLIEQDANSTPVNPLDPAQTKDQAFTINCSDPQQKSNAAVAEKFLKDFYTWKWDDLLFSLDRDAKVYFQMTDGAPENLRCPSNMPEGATCTGTDGMYYGRLAYLNIIYFFKANLIENEYRIAIKTTQCTGPDLVTVTGHVNGSVVARDENQNGIPTHKVWFDTPVSWTFQINQKGKISKEQIFVPADFVPVLFGRLYSPDNSSVELAKSENARLEREGKPKSELREMNPVFRRVFANTIIEKLNVQLRNANDPKDLPYQIKK